MDTAVLFVAALDWEAKQIVRHVASPAVSVRGLAKLWRGRVGEREIAVLRTGVGPTRAATALTWAAEAVRPAVVLSTGCAGGLVDTLVTGDVLVADEVVGGDGRCWPTGARWCERYVAAAERAGARVFAGRVFTSAQVIDGTAAKRAAAARACALAVDMEGAALAERAAAMGLEFAAARVILDAAATSIPRELIRASGETGRPSARRLLSAVLRRPALVSELWALGCSAAACRRVLCAIHRELALSLARERGLPNQGAFGMKA